jgi:hypothetical protein
MFNRALLILFVIPPLVALVPRQVQAQSAAALQHRRFEQVLKEVGGSDEKISEEQLMKFIKRKLDEKLASPSGGPILVPENYVHQQATRIMNRVNHDQNGSIEENELADFEEAPLALPLPPKMKDLLPPPEGGVPPAPIAKENEGEQVNSRRSWIDRLGDLISVRQSFLDEKKIGKPATFSWTRFGKEDETLETGRDRSKFEVQGAVAFEPNLYPSHSLGSYRLMYNPVFVFEIDSSSETKDTGHPGPPGRIPGRAGQGGPDSKALGAQP